MAQCRPHGRQAPRNNTVYFKPETDIGNYSNDGAYPVAAGTDLYMRIDGIKTNATKDGYVVKVPSHFAVEVEPDGKTNIVNLPFESKLGYGEVTKPDESWDKLEKSTRPTN